MGNPSKAKGTRAESKVVKFLESYGIKAKRKALTGSKDEGDVCLTDLNITLEIKAGKQTANPNRTQLEMWLDQANVESRNSQTVCYLCVVRYNRQIKDADVYIRDKGFRKHMYLDEFAEYCI